MVHMSGESDANFRSTDVLMVCGDDDLDVF